ncbi:hypothetical protein M2253_000724 [Leucobacter luti]|nr:hypothetical protein [Leucobacter luti]MCW2287627.1 hypothetical protein [Leucobacter luti]
MVFTRAEQLLAGDAEFLGERLHHRDIRVGEAAFPLRDGGLSDVEPSRKLALRETGGAPALGHEATEIAARNVWAHQ